MKHWQGFFLSLVSASLWGVLPVFLQICLQVMDSSTITWFRFFVAAVFVFSLLLVKSALPKYRQLDSSVLTVLLLAALALVANYVANVEGLNYVSPETAQVVMQIAPIILMLGGVLIYKESFNKIQIFGAGLLFCGLLLFFNHRLPLLFSALNQLNIGVLLVVFAAAAWAGYALLQKSLLRSFTANQLTLSIYAIGAIILLPLIDISPLFELNTIQAFALAFCCLNTIIAYGAFTQALNVWDASKVSAVIATGPIFTILSVTIAERFMPDFFSSSVVNIWTLIGAICVVSGSMAVALAKNRAL